MDGPLASFLVSIVLATIGAGGVAFAAGPASGEGPRDELDRWVPSVGLFGGFQSQDADGSIEPGMLSPDAPRCTPDPTNTDCRIDSQIQPDEEGDGTILAFRAGGSFELMTPRVVEREALGHPRFFAHVDPMYSAGFEQNIAGTGSPGAMVEPDFPDAVTRSDERAFTGQGTRLLAAVDPFVLNAGLGVAFTFDVRGRRVRVKPSLEYLREGLEITGQANRVVQVAQMPTPDTPDQFRFISLEARDRQVYHAIGPGLGIEIDASRYGPFVLSPFVSAQAFRFFGGLDVELSDANEFDESAEWRFERDRWQWSAKFGVRLRWLPR